MENKPQVTKAWLAEKVKTNPERTIGRALAAIYKNQTATEQDSASTIRSNGIGFSKPDARVGSLAARMYNEHGKLEGWLVRVWLKPAKDGYPRICKYAAQLQVIAEAKKAALQRTHVPSNFNLVSL